jgi:hypothetical protein
MATLTYFHSLLVSNRNVGDTTNDTLIKEKGDIDLGAASHTFSPCTQKDILTFIGGSLVGLDDVGINQTDNTTHSDGDRTKQPVNSTIQQEESNFIPSMKRIAKEGKLDEKQNIAYEVICCTFLLQLMFEMVVTSEDMRKHQDLMKELKARGAQEQLVMLLTGAASCGKSTSVILAQTFCHKFCKALSVPFVEATFYFTSTTGSSAVLFGGTTIHSAAHLNAGKINDAFVKEWEYVRVLIIDEISVLCGKDMNNLDNKLKRL